MRRSREGSETSVGLFAFLDVLMSTMGSLILVLMIVSPKIRQEAVVKAATQAAHDLEKAPPPPVPAPVPVPAPSPAPPRPTIDLNEKYLAHVTELSGRVDEKSRIATDAAKLLSAAQEKSQQARAEREKLERQLAELRETKNREQAAIETVSAEGVKVETELARRGSRLRKIRDQIAHQSTEYSFVAYDGVSGTTRRPILIECDHDQIRFAQENITLTPADLAGFSTTANPVRAGAEALVDYWSTHSAPNEPKPYVLLVVRPSGTLGYYRARNLLQRMKAPFGYELLPEDQKLATQPPDPQAVIACRTAVDQTVARRESVFDQSVAGGILGLRNPWRRGGGGSRDLPGTAGGSGAKPGAAEDPFDVSSLFGGPAKPPAGPIASSGPGSGAGPAMGPGPSMTPGTGMTPGGGAVAQLGGGAGSANGSMQAGGSIQAGSSNQPGRAGDKPQGVGGGSASEPGGRSGGNELQANATGSGGSPSSPTTSSFPPSIIPRGGGRGAPDSSEDALAGGGGGAPEAGSVGPVSFGPAGGQAPPGGSGSGPVPPEADSPAVLGPPQVMTANDGGQLGGGQGPSMGSRMSPASVGGDSGGSDRGDNDPSGEAGQSASGSTEDAGGAGMPSFGGGDSDPLNRGTARHRWGSSSSRASIGFERDVTITIGARAITVGSQAALAVTESEPSRRLAARVVNSLDREARSWERPPEHLYWVPNIKFVVTPGGNLTYERLRPAILRHGLISSVEYRLDTDRPRTNFGKWAE